MKVRFKRKARKSSIISEGFGKNETINVYACFYLSSYIHKVPWGSPSSEI